MKAESRKLLDQLDETMAEFGQALADWTKYTTKSVQLLEQQLNENEESPFPDTIILHMNQEA